MSHVSYVIRDTPGARVILRPALPGITCGKVRPCYKLPSSVALGW